MPSHNYEPTLVFVSNPFGYGPTGTIIPVIKKFEEETELPLVFLGSGICLEIIRSKIVRWKRLEIIEGNERDIGFLSSALSNIKNPHVISSLNRFVVQTANESKIPNALIDPLGWFWERRPEEFGLADIYFYNNFGSRLNVNNSIFHEIPLIVAGNPTDRQTGLIVFNIGGSRNPLIGGLQENYLKLLIMLLSRFPGNIQKKIIVAGGHDAIEFLKKESDANKCISSFRSFSYFEFEKLISTSTIVITPAGMGVTFSSIFLNKPTIIYLPENLSQLKLGRVLTGKNIVQYILKWGNYINSFDEDMRSEEYSISKIDSYASKVIHNKKSFDKLSRDFLDLVELVLKNGEKPNSSKLKFGGESSVFKVLTKNWHLTNLHSSLGK